MTSQYVAFNRLFSGNKFTLSFEVKMTASSYSGDGMCLFFYNTNILTPGGYGGSLGYANLNAINGIPGALLGIGLDYFGNFSHNIEKKNGPSNYSPNSISVRLGADDKYNYLTNKKIKNSLIQKDFYKVNLTYESGKITVELLDTKLTFKYTLPQTFKIGVSGGTGAATMKIAIKNFAIQYGSSKD